MTARCREHDRGGVERAKATFAHPAHGCHKADWKTKGGPSWTAARLGAGSGDDLGTSCFSGIPERHSRARITRPRQICAQHERDAESARRSAPIRSQHRGGLDHWEIEHGARRYLLRHMRSVTRIDVRWWPALRRSSCRCRIDRCVTTGETRTGNRAPACTMPRLVAAQELRAPQGRPPLDRRDS
jgi:hypothetical protein